MSPARFLSEGLQQLQLAQTGKHVGRWGAQGSIGAVRCGARRGRKRLPNDPAAQPPCWCSPRRNPMAPLPASEPYELLETLDALDAL